MATVASTAVHVSSATPAMSSEPHTEHFSVPLLDGVVHCSLTVLAKSIQFWCGSDTPSSAYHTHLVVAMPFPASGAVATTLSGSCDSEDWPQALAKRLAARTGKQVFVSVSLQTPAAGAADADGGDAATMAHAVVERELRKRLGITGVGAAPAAAAAAAAAK